LSCPTVFKQLTNPGTVSIDLTAGQSSDIFTSIRQNLTQASLVAYTRFDLGGDAVNYVSKNEEVTETRKTLFDIILQAVKDLV